VPTLPCISEYFVPHDPHRPSLDLAVESNPDPALATVLPDAAPGGVTAGVDWATADHAVAIVNGAGVATDRFTVPANAAGLRELARRLCRTHVGEVAIERSDGRVVDTLLAAGITVVVIPPGQVANLRGRYRSAGNKDDRFDAYVLADTLRTDRARLRPLIPDTPATCTFAPPCARARIY
jgi:transposase